MAKRWFERASRGAGALLVCCVLFYWWSLVEEVWFVNPIRLGTVAGTLERLFVTFITGGPGVIAVYYGLRAAANNDGIGRRGVAACYSAALGSVLVVWLLIPRLGDTQGGEIRDWLVGVTCALLGWVVSLIAYVSCLLIGARVSGGQCWPVRRFVPEWAVGGIALHVWVLAIGTFALVLSGGSSNVAMDAAICALYTAIGLLLRKVLVWLSREGGSMQAVSPPV